MAADSQLQAPATGDFHLTLGSPAINAGNPAYAAASGERDLDFAARIIGRVVDRGSTNF